LGGSLLNVTSATGSGPSANVRQLTAVISLGAAFANTGGNATTGVAVASGADNPELRVSLQLTPQASGGSISSVITTGDVVAENGSLVILCQLSSSPGHPCLKPTVVDPPTGVATVGATGSEPQRVLPATSTAPAAGVDSKLSPAAGPG